MDWIQGIFTAAMSKKLIPFMALVGDRRTIDKNRLIDFIVMLGGVVLAIQFSVNDLKKDYEHVIDTMKRENESMHQALVLLQQEVRELRQVVYQPAWGVERNKTNRP